MNRLTRNLLVGLSILLPVVLSIQLVVWIFSTIEQSLKSVWVLLLTEELYFPGIAFASFILLALAVGYSSRYSMVSKIWKLPGYLIEKTPVINYVYSTIKDFLDLMGGKSFSDQSVVWVTLPHSDSRLLGIVTKKGGDGDSKLAQMIEEKEVAVYLPMSYQAGGYMVIVPVDQTEKADIEPGEALRLIMSAGLGQGQKKSKKKA